MPWNHRLHGRVPGGCVRRGPRAPSVEVLEAAVGAKNTKSFRQAISRLGKADKKAAASPAAGAGQ